MKFFSQSFLYDDPWSIVSLAYFLRYPNPHSSHVISSDVISRTHTPSGTLLTTRLLVKHYGLPKWTPKMISNSVSSRQESYVIEESEVDPWGRVLRCRTRNLDYVKIMQMEETVLLRQADDGYRTLQTTKARVVSRFGWGLAKRIEDYGLSRFKTNIQKSREGVSVILGLIHQSRLQPMTLGPAPLQPAPSMRAAESSHQSTHEVEIDALNDSSAWDRLKSCFRRPR